MSDRSQEGGTGEERADESFYPDVIGSRLVHEGRIVNLRVDEITTPRGDVVTREVVGHPGAVVVAALDDRENVFLVKQYRHAVGRYLVELPAGGLEPGEEPLAAARRELREEVGLEAGRWTSLGSFFSSPGFASECLYAFLATDLTSVSPDPDDDEDISVVRYPLRDVLRHVREVADAKTLATLHLVDDLLGRGPST